MFYAFNSSHPITTLQHLLVDHLLLIGGIHEKIDFLNSSQNRYFFFVYASAAIYKNYAEVGAYNSSWIKSYEHRSKFIFISARPS